MSAVSGEFDFIAGLRALATSPAARGLNDDAAALEIGGETLVLTQDTLIDGVHVLDGSDPADIAWKLVAVNLSDLAAKGAQPIGMLLSHAVGYDDTRFLSGLNDAIQTFDAPLLGGDTVAMPEGSARSWTLTAIGRATHLPVPGRDGASAGDGIYITGQLGAALIGFEALRDGSDEDSTAYRRPQPRLAQGQALAPLVSAMMDISDGLLLDAWRMGSASSVTMAIDRNSIPIATPEARRDEALRWGDDYELLFTAPDGTSFPCEVHRIGTVEYGAHPLALDGEAIQSPDGLGYQH